MYMLPPMTAEYAIERAEAYLWIWTILLKPAYETDFGQFITKTLLYIIMDPTPIKVCNYYKWKHWAVKVVAYLLGTWVIIFSAVATKTNLLCEIVQLKDGRQCNIARSYLNHVFLIAVITVIVVGRMGAVLSDMEQTKRDKAFEQERNKAEQERNKAEQERTKAEQERTKAEQERTKAEQREQDAIADRQIVHAKLDTALAQIADLTGDSETLDSFKHRMVADAQHKLEVTLMNNLQASLHSTVQTSVEQTMNEYNKPYDAWEHQREIDQMLENPTLMEAMSFL